MTTRWTLFFLFSVLTVFSCGSKQSKQSKQSQPDSQSSANHSILLPADDFEKKLTEIADKQIIDVRTPEEFANGHIKGALNINYQGEHFTEEVGKLDKNKPVFVYCEMGGRSEEATKYMHNQGFKEIYELKNGLKSWKHFSKPVE